jgi:Holliday junction resolvasome RuvABC endonuclease subunit
MKKVLTLDVAYTNIGWAVIEPYKNSDIITNIGCISNKSDPKKKKAMYASNVMVERVGKLYRNLRDVYLEHKPSAIVAEIPTGGGKSHKATEGMALGTSVAAILTTQFDIPVEWTTPDDGKVAMCRCKTASKLQMQAAAISKFPELRRMVPVSKRSKSGYESWFEHSADAIAAFLAARNGSLVRYLADDNGDYDAENVLF